MLNSDTTLTPQSVNELSLPIGWVGDRRATRPVLQDPHRKKERPGMLVLTRKYGQQIMIGDGIVITILEGRGDSIRIGVEAPGNISVKRAEVYEAVSAEM